MVITPHFTTGVLVLLITERVCRTNDSQGRMKRRTKMALSIGYPLAFASHFLLDAFAHYDYSIDSPDKTANIIKLMLDFTVSMMICGWVFRHWMAPVLQTMRESSDGWLKNPETKGSFSTLKLPLVLMAGGFWSILPDIIVGISRHFMYASSFWFNDFHDFLHSSWRPDPLFGFFTQAAWCALVVWALVNLARELKLDLIAEEYQAVSESGSWLGQKNRR